MMTQISSTAFWGNEYHGELCIKHLLTSAIKMTIIAEKKRHATDITQNNR